MTKSTKRKVASLFGFGKSTGIKDRSSSSDSNKNNNQLAASSSQSTSSSSSPSTDTHKQQAQNDIASSVSSSGYLSSNQAAAAAQTTPPNRRESTATAVRLTRRLQHDDDVCDVCNVDETNLALQPHTLLRDGDCPHGAQSAHTRMTRVRQLVQLRNRQHQEQEQQNRVYHINAKHSGDDISTSAFASHNNQADCAATERLLRRRAWMATRALVPMSIDEPHAHTAAAASVDCLMTSANDIDDDIDEFGVDVDADTAAAAGELIDDINNNISANHRFAATSTTRTFGVGAASEEAAHQHHHHHHHQHSDHTANGISAHRLLRSFDTSRYNGDNTAADSDTPRHHNITAAPGATADAQFWHTARQQQQQHRPKAKHSLRAPTDHTFERRSAYHSRAASLYNSTAADIDNNDDDNDDHYQDLNAQDAARSVYGNAYQRYPGAQQQPPPPPSILVYAPFGAHHQDQFHQVQQQYHSFASYDPRRPLNAAPPASASYFATGFPAGYALALAQPPPPPPHPDPDYMSEQRQTAALAAANLHASARRAIDAAENSRRQAAAATAQEQHRHRQSTYTKRKTNKKMHNSKQDNKPSIGVCGQFAKLLLFVSNIFFWSAGVALGAWGILSLVDDHKYNLSQLLVFEPSTRMSLFQLLSWSYITLGCASVLVGVCGCSAILKSNRWILGLYIFLILAIFALDLATGLLAIIFQERLVANVRLRLGNKLRSDYGVQASFTAAIDYIQTRYECCGLEGHFDYDQSLWRLQRLGGFEATVARTCCHLRNTFDDQAHINPRPVNESMCQSTDVRFHQSYRYRRGCLDDLERLVRHKIWTFTLGCGGVGAVILLSLFFATCFCRSIPITSSRKSSADSTATNDARIQNHYLSQHAQMSSAAKKSAAASKVKTYHQQHR